jgi:A/G-specific adenine glycosylase
VRWYRKHARDLPWRHTRDPYAIWVSEVMLQQTRVETVLRYYAPFLKRFQNVRALARASEDDVMAAWSGLGYYRRARLLHAGAKAVVERHAGRVPIDASERLALPGVGRYTAGAIGSIALGRCEPIVDGNVARVLARVFGVATPLGRSDTTTALWQHAEALVQGRDPSALNQALMELGATVCTPQQPRCADCPVRRHCVARADERVDALPVRKPRRQPRAVPLLALVATPARRRSVWLVREGGALYGGLWNLPMREGSGRRAALALTRASANGAELGTEPIARFEHVLTHRRLKVEVWRAQGRLPADGLFGPTRLDAVGVSTLTRRALSAAGLLDE